jgi:hypothetical protein
MAKNHTCKHCIYSHKGYDSCLETYSGKPSCPHFRALTGYMMALYCARKAFDIGVWMLILALGSALLYVGFMALICRAWGM